MARRKRKIGVTQGIDAEVELNVMPFIDIFSLLCTFLLFSAVFVTIGILQVQIPFFTNAAPEPGAESTRELEISVDITARTIALSTEFTEPPSNLEKDEFPRTTAGIERFHAKLVELKDGNPKTDKVTLYADDDIIYEDFIEVLDQIKLRFAGDSGFSSEENATGIDSFLFPKVIVGSVIL